MPEPSANTLVGLELSKRIDAATLLSPTDIEVLPGECVVLRGDNGSGKSTLLRILAGRLTPTTGTVTCEGRPVDDRQSWCRAAIGALIGQPATYRDLTLADHLTLVDATWGVPAEQVPDRVAASLAALQIDHLADRFPGELSSGQQQLFHLALALTRPARFLLLDEPEQRLDTAKRALVTDLLRTRVSEGAGLVVACHDPVMTQALGDAVLDLHAAW